MWVPRTKGTLKEHANPRKSIPQRKLRIPQLVSAAQMLSEPTVLKSFRRSGLLLRLLQR